MLQPVHTKIPDTATSHQEAQRNTATGLTDTDKPDILSLCWAGVQLFRWEIYKRKQPGCYAICWLEASEIASSRSATILDLPSWVFGLPAWGEMAQLQSVCEVWDDCLCSCHTWEQEGPTELQVYLDHRRGENLMPWGPDDSNLKTDSSTLNFCIFCNFYFGKQLLFFCADQFLLESTLILLRTREWLNGLAELPRLTSSESPS